MSTGRPTESEEGTGRRAAEAGAAVAALVVLMDRLRSDCPWDRKQTFRELSGYLLEECYEALDALAREDLAELEGELGDLLFQVVFLARLGSEKGAFDLASVARRIHGKMVSRHPHVFGEAEVRDAEAVRVQWEEIKERERRAKADGGDSTAASPFAGVPRALPALLKAIRVTSRAADLGFDWQRDADVLDKLDEEVAEFKAELLAPDASPERVAHELGDILFTVVNVARRHRIDPEAALQATSARFVRRFEEVARRVVARGGTVRESSLAELDAIWDEVKAEEEGGSPAPQTPRTDQ